MTNISIKSQNKRDITTVYEETETKLAIKNNEKLEDTLHMIICISNPCNYKKRYLLANEFIRRMRSFEDITLYVVELAYDKQPFMVTDGWNKNHLQLRTNSSPIWSKENLLNIGVTLLPKDWKAVAFCDSDVNFDNIHMAADALKILNGFKDVVQLHSHCLDLDQDGTPMKIFSSFAYQHCMKQEYSRKDHHFFHGGYNICMTRKAYDKIGKIYEKGILGSGDSHFFLSMIGQGQYSLGKNMSKQYRNSVLDFQEKCRGLRLGYVPGIIRHYFHGSKINRGYVTRWSVLFKHQYDPYTHITYDKNGVMIPSQACPKVLLDDIKEYFASRNEDE
jgi:hypothetical protein